MEQTNTSSIKEVEISRQFLDEFAKLMLGYGSPSADACWVWNTVSLLRDVNVFQKLLLSTALYTKLVNKCINSEYLDWCLKNVSEGSLKVVRKSINGGTTFQDNILAGLDERKLINEVFYYTYINNLVKVLPKVVVKTKNPDKNQ